MFINSFGLEFGSGHQGPLSRIFFSLRLLCCHRQVTWSLPLPRFSVTRIMIAPLPSSTAVWIN